MKSVQLSRPQNRSECSICLLNFKCGLFANNTNKITDMNSTSRIEAICTCAVFIQNPNVQSILFSSYSKSLAQCGN